MIIECHTPEGQKPWKVTVNGRKADVTYVNDVTLEYRKWVGATVRTFQATNIMIDHNKLTIRIENVP